MGEPALTGFTQEGEGTSVGCLLTLPIWITINQANDGYYFDSRSANETVRCKFQLSTKYLQTHSCLKTVCIVQTSYYSWPIVQ